MISDARRAELLGTTALADGSIPGPVPAGMEQETPEAPARPAEPPMDDDEFEETCRQIIDNARALLDEETMPEVDRAWRYYNGEVDQAPMGLIGQDPDTGEDVYEGSGVVLTECRDQVQTLIPDIYRVLAGSEEAIAFQPEGPEDTEYSKQANDYVRHLFWDRNNGETLIKDGLLEWSVKFTAYRVWRENAIREHVTEHEDLDELQAQALADTEGVEIEEAEVYRRMIPVPKLQPDGTVMYGEQPIQLYRVRCRYRETYGRTRIALVPQDELLIDLEAQDIEESTVVGQDGDRRASDLIAMGLDPETVKRLAGKGLRRAGRLYGDDIRRNRAASRTIERGFRDNKDPSLQWVRTVDAKVMVDRDRDGIAEAWRIIAIGEPLEIVWAREDPGSDAIVVGSPFPRPHRLIGDGIVETTMDLQDIGTSIIRRALDNFARSVNPKLFVTGADETTMDELQSWFNGPVQLSANGRVDVVQIPFNGAAIFPLLEYFDQRRTLRTGISAASQGLDPRALKGQTVEAAASIVQGPQSRVEGLAREFATRVMRPLFKAILKITCAYQDRPDVIRLRNKFVSVDPSKWNADMDVSVEVGLGTGSRIERMIAVGQVIGKQEQLYAAQSPLFDLQKYRQALADFVHAMGVKDDERYFPAVDDEAVQRFEQQAEQKRKQQLQEAVAIEKATEEAKQAARAEAEIAIDQNQTRLEHMAKQQQLALEGTLDQALARLEGAIKARLLEIEGRIEAELIKLKPKPAASAGTNANVRKQ
jgi:hypothetical protein